MIRFKQFLPGILICLFALFYFLVYNNTEDLHQASTGFGKAINSLMIILYHFLGQVGTFALLIGLACLVTYLQLKKRKAHP